MDRREGQVRNQGQLAEAPLLWTGGKDRLGARNQLKKSSRLCRAAMKNVSYLLPVKLAEIGNNLYINQQHS